MNLLDNMFFLADFTPIRPAWGLILWTTLIFFLFWWLIGKFSFRPIADALKKRENDIQSALDEAKKAREEMSHLQAKNQKLLSKAREERAIILKEAKDASNKLITESKEKAKVEAQKIVISAKQEIENQKKQALRELKNEVGAMALDIAEKVIRKQLADNSEQKSFVDSLVDELKLN